MTRLAPPLAALVLLAGSSCSRAPSEPPSSELPPASHPGDASTLSAPLLPVTWNDPPTWQRRRPKTTARAAEYLVPRAAGDGEDAECTVFGFGPQQGGTPEQNLQRWVGQFAELKEKPSRATRPATPSGALTVDRVEVAGTYTPMRLPGESVSPEPKPGYRLIGAVVNAPSGLWFFKLTGPDATVRAAAHDFDTMVQAVRPR